MRSRLTALRARIVAAPLESWITVAVVVGAVAFTFAQLHPNLIFRNTTPTGGDMGAHVWSGTYLRDHLLPHGRLSGWTPDWYAGAPAFQFYMVVPFLAILALDVVLPYAVAFKLIVVSGVVLMPAAAWAFGKLAGLRFPGPPMLAAATVFFLFDSSFTIYGGNIASTMAGEFAFAISLSLGAGLSRGRGPGPADREAPRPGRRAARPRRALPPHTRPLRRRRHGGHGRPPRPPRLGALGADGGARRRPARGLLGPALRLAAVLHERHGLGEDPALVQPRPVDHRLVGPGGRLPLAVGHPGGVAVGPGRGRRRDRRAANARTSS